MDPDAQDRHGGSPTRVEGAVESDTCNEVTSLPPEAIRFGHVVHGHRRERECTTPGMLAISLRADDSRICQEHGIENCAVLRPIALNLSLRDSRRKRAGEDPEHLLQVFAG